MRMRMLMLIVIAALPLGTAAAGREDPPPRRISRTVLEDKIRGGWAGQMIGVSFGAPTEFVSNGRTIGWPIEWKPDAVANAIGQDDLYVEMTFAQVLDSTGLDATTEQFGEMFRDSRYHLWHANASARRLLNRGIKAPMSGHPRYNAHANDIDFQIESDFIGLMAPGLPQVAAAYADRIGRVMNYGDGLYGGMFVSGMYAAAFFETDVRRVVEAGVRSIPPDSRYARIIRDVLAWSAETPGDWKATWRRVTDTWDRDDPCPDGALHEFNIDAGLNGAFIALGLLYGGGDFARTLDVATRAGQDSDCNPSSAAGILGVVLGYAAIPEPWKAGIPALADTKFEYTNYSFNGIVSSTMARAMRIVERAGGTVTSKELIVPHQEPAAPVLEQWQVDPPTARLDSSHGSWAWSADWDEGPSRGGRVKTASTPGAEVTLTFHGTGAIIVGRYTERGGRADVFLDGQPAGEIEARQVPRTHDNVYWHATGLPSGVHSVRVVVRPARDPVAGGTSIAIERAVILGR
jgi:hypothetical protein